MSIIYRGNCIQNDIPPHISFDIHPQMTPDPFTPFLMPSCVCKPVQSLLRLELGPFVLVTYWRETLENVNTHAQNTPVLSVAIRAKDYLVDEKRQGNSLLR